MQAIEKKSRGMKSIEDKMQDLDEGSLRYKVLQAANEFKGSWISLGRCLYSVFQDKLYKEWGYMTFEAYCAKEIGIRKQTAVKLLRSYYFLENEEPQILNLKVEAVDRDAVSKFPSYEAVNCLRLAKVNKKLDKKDYEVLRQDVLQNGKEPKEVKNQLRSMITVDEPQTEEERRRRCTVTIRRTIAALSLLKQQLSQADMLPKQLLGEIERLIGHLQEKI